MTVGTFLSDMCAEIKRIFSEWKATDESGGFERVSVFEQALPVQSGEDSAEPFPYIVVRVEDGGATTPNTPETVRVRFTIGVFDDNAGNRGHIDVLNMIDCIRQRFEREQTLCEQYYRLQSDQYPLRWAVPDDDTFPYFFGALEMFFAIPKIETEDKLT